MAVIRGNYTIGVKSRVGCETDMRLRGVRALRTSGSQEIQHCIRLGFIVLSRGELRLNAYGKSRESWEFIEGARIATFVTPITPEQG